jgi:hypothetical protein
MLIEQRTRHELLPSSEKAWIYIAMTRIMLMRLAQSSS